MTDQLIKVQPIDLADMIRQQLIDAALMRRAELRAEDERKAQACVDAFKPLATMATNNTRTDQRCPTCGQMMP